MYFNLRSLFRLVALCSVFVLASSSFAAQQLIVEPEMGRGPLFRAIADAKSSVDIVMYGLTDLDFVDALMKAKTQGKAVRVLLQHYPYRAEDENVRAIDLLRSDKINLAWPSQDFKLTHQKTFLLDRQKAIVMTFNLTHSTFKNERNFALIITDAPLVAEIQQVFDADWQHQSVHPVQSDLVFSPDNSREKILAFIRSATTHLQIYAEGLTDYEIVGELARAAKRGVRVEILTSPPREANNDRPNKKWDYLQKSGVVIRFDKEYMIHAKVIINDEASALLGSINLTRPSINDNRELSVITRDADVVRQLETIFSRDWRHTDAKSEATISAVNDHLLQTVRRFSQMAKKHYHHAYNQHRKRKKFQYT